MDQTPLLKLPYILAAQSQKHVTHNEALKALDALVHLAVEDRGLNTAPGSPAEGERHIVGSSPTGAWAGHAQHVAAYQDGAWMFYAPVEGWVAWVADEGALYAFNGGGWIEAASGGGGGGGASVNPVSLVGVNATADTTDRLSVSSPAALFSHEGAGHQLKINKAASGDTASVLFQTGFSGRAEFGLAGDDDFHVKVSPDGSAWYDALVISRSSGAVCAKAGQADVASASTCDIGAASAQRVRITGTTTITSLGTEANALRFATFAGVLLLTHNATSLVLPTAGNITTAAGDTAIFASDASGNWRCLAYQRASGQALASAGGSGGINPNLITNGDGAINQRGAASGIADDTYAWDRHYVLTQANPVAVSTLSDVADGVPSMFRLTQSHATAQRMGAATILEARDSKIHRGGSVTLSGHVRASSAATVRWAVLEWTGTEDTVTSDVVNSWTNGTYTAGQFFLGSGLTVAATGSAALSANTLTSFSLPATISSTCNNLIVLIWTSATAAQNVTLDWRWKLEAGASATAWVQRARSEEMHRCLRYYYRLDSSGNVYATFTFGYAASTTVCAVGFTFQVEMLGIPSFSYGSPLSFTQSALNNVSSVNANRLTKFGGEVAFNGSGFSSLSSGKLQANNSLSVYIAFDAEL